MSDLKLFDHLTTVTSKTKMEVSYSLKHKQNLEQVIYGKTSTMVTFLFPSKSR